MKYLIEINDDAIAWYKEKTQVGTHDMKIIIQQAVGAATMIPSYSIKVEEDNGKEERKGNRKSR